MRLFCRITHNNNTQGFQAPRCDILRPGTSIDVPIGLDPVGPGGGYRHHGVPPADAVRGNVAPAGSATTPSACTDRGSSGAAAFARIHRESSTPTAVFPSHNGGGLSRHQRCHQRRAQPPIELEETIQESPTTTTSHERDEVSEESPPSSPLLQRERQGTGHLASRRTKHLR